MIFTIHLAIKVMNPCSRLSTLGLSGRIIIIKILTKTKKWMLNFRVGWNLQNPTLYLFYRFTFLLFVFQTKTYSDDLFFYCCSSCKLMLWAVQIISDNCRGGGGGTIVSSDLLMLLKIRFHCIWRWNFIHQNFLFENKIWS